MKKLGLGLVAIFMIALCAPLILPPLQATAANEDKLCIPVHEELGGDRWATSAFIFSFVSRFQVDVTYQAIGNCASPSGLSANLLHESGIEFAPFVNQSLYLRRHTSNGKTFVIYGVGDGVGGAAQGDESMIVTKNWESGPGVDSQARDNDWATYRKQDDAGIDAMLRNAHYTIGIEEDLLNGAATCPGTNSNFHLINEDNDGKGVKWRCDNDSTNGTGADVLSSIRNKQNFNIVFKVNDDGSKIENLYTSNAKFNFTYCTNRYVNDNCNGDLIISMSREQAMEIGEGTRDLNITGGENMTVVAAGNIRPVTNVGDLQGNGEQEEDNSCESAGGALGWIMCPIAGLLDSVVGFLDENIRDLLYVNQDYFDTEKDSGEDLKGAWTQFRNIAYVILIPIMLVMVIGTALGFEVFSAYTIKKALPRMIIAIIFITLSWYICVFLVNFFNVIGGGLTNLVTAPFSEIHSVAGEAGRSPLKGALDAAGITQAGNGWVQSIASGTTVTTLGVAGVVGAFATGALSLGIIMSTLATAALILGGIFLLLIVRQMLVIALALLAPLAILAWIFPGNDKLWKLWWGSFSKLLMLYPLITLLIGVGQVFAYVTGVARVGDNQLITVIIIIASFIMPFFFIPFAFKWAGGVFGNLAGMVNDRERGLLDRLKKGRANMRERHSADAKNFGRFKGSNRLTQGLNTFGGALRNRPGSYMSWDAFRQNKKTLGIDRGKLLSTQTAAQLVKAEEDLKADRVFQANKNNDKFLLALANREHAERLMERARNKGNKMEEAAWSQALHAASTVKTANSIGTRLFAIQAHAATGYNLSAGQQGYNELADSVIKTLGINAEHIVRDEATNDIIGVTGPQAGLYTEIMNSSQYALKSAGRYDLGGINNGKGYDPQKGVAKASLYQLSNSKPESIMAMTEQYFDSSTGQLQPNTMDEAGVTYLELQSMLPNATGAAAEEIQKQLQRLNEAGIGSYLSQGSGNMERDPVTGTEKQKEVEDRVYYKGQSDWSEADRIRGWKIIRRAETNADVLAKRARTYQRPDPNTIDSSEA